MVERYIILIDELINDPEGRGYSGMTDQQVVDDLNSEYRDIPKPSLTGGELFDAIDITEFRLLSSSDKARIDRLISISDSFEVGLGTNGRSELINVFGTSSKTITALSARVKRSRAVELGISSWVIPSRVAQARTM